MDKEIIPVARDWEHAGRYPTEIVEKMKELGLFGLRVPEEHCGMGADSVSFALTFEEIARGWMGIAGILGSHSVSCWMIAKHGTEEQKARYLPDLAAGARRTGIALTEAGAGTDLQGIATTARRDGDHYVVNGTKMWITNARYADPLPVLVKTDPAVTPAHRGMSILLVEAGTPGFEVTKDIPKLGYRGTESCEVLLTDVRVHSDQLLGGIEGGGMQQVLSALETGRINVASRAIGVAQRAYEEALKYSRDRTDALDRAWFVPRELLVPDLSYTVQGYDLPGAGTMDRETALQAMPAVLSLFDDDSPLVEIRHMIAEGRWVLAEAQGTGAFRDGTPYENRYANVYEVVAGRIRTIREYMDTQHMANLLAVANQVA